MLHHLEPDNTLRVVLPEPSRRNVFDEAHGGTFGGHLRDAKIHGELGKHFWWPKMRRDIRSWCHACLTSATRRVGRKAKPPLTPIPVGGPFDRIGVDVIQFPASFDGNQYAVVFVDYLTKWPEVFAIPDQTALTIARALVEGVVSRHGVCGIAGDVRGDNLSFYSNNIFTAVTRQNNTCAHHREPEQPVYRTRSIQNSVQGKQVNQLNETYNEASLKQHRQPMLL